MRLAQFNYQVKQKFIVIQVLCVEYFLPVLFFCQEITWNISLICFARPAPSLKSAEMQWATQCRKSSKTTWFLITVNYDTGSFAPASWPFLTSDCSSSVCLILASRGMVVLFNCVLLGLECMKKEGVAKRGESAWEQKCKRPGLQSRAAVVAESPDIQSACPFFLPLQCSVS